MKPSHEAAIALSRCYGALFFSVFGSCWLLLSSYAFGAFRAAEIAAILLVCVFLVGLALRIQRRAGRNAADPLPEAQRKRDNRSFAIVNAVQWVAVFLIFSIFPKIGWNDFSFPAVLLVIGLHFFAMPPSYRHTSNFVTGALMVAWAIFCPLLFKGDFMVALVALGAGLTLWGSAAWALAFAARRLRSAELGIVT